MPKTSYYKEAENLLTYGTMILDNNWSTLQKFKTLSEEEDNYAKVMIEKKKVKKSPVQSPESEKQPAPKPKIVLDSEEEDGNKLIKKALRKRRAINYNEDPVVQAENPVTNPIEPVGVVTTPNIPGRRKKLTNLGKKTQPPAPAPAPQKKETPVIPEKRPPPVQEIHGKDDTYQGYFEMLAQREEEASKYLYSNPIIATFNDPTLCFAEMCSLCGAFGNQVTSCSYSIG
jgi:hypothetical protein